MTFTLTQEGVEIALFFVAQLLLAYGAIRTMRADLRNLTGWVKQIDTRAECTSERVLRIQGHLGLTD